jgi:hypothetical protein
MSRLLLLASFLCAAWLRAEDFAQVPMADGFVVPVGQNGKEYYRSRGLRANGHLGEDWNGVGGGDTDLGDAVYSTAHGIVVFARDFRMGWGNVVIIRHAYQEKGREKDAPLFVDSLYGHLLNIAVKEGDIVRRDQRIGSIGNNRGMYEAHLHFEMRKDIRVGMFRNNFPQDSSVYHDPSVFISEHPQLSPKARFAKVPINTFPTQTTTLVAKASPPPPPPSEPTPLRPPSSTLRGGVSFRVDRFSDLRLRE